MKHFSNTIIKNTSGFGFLPVLIVAGVIGVITVAGFAVYNASQSSDSELQSTSANCSVGSSVYIERDTSDLFDIGCDVPVVEGDVTQSTALESLDNLTPLQQANLENVEVDRIGSDSRYLTAIEVSKKRFDGSNGSRPDKIVLVNGESYSDAIVGVSISSSSPLLYMPPTEEYQNELFRAVADEIVRLKQLGASSLTIIGGENAISNQQLSFLGDMTGLNSQEFVRIPGASRVETSINAAKSSGNYSGTVFIANGFVESDSTLFQRGYEEGPLVFINQDGSMHPATLEYLQEQNPNKIVLLGGSSVISNATRDELSSEFADAEVLRLGGTTRVQTAVAISAGRYPNENCDCTVYLVNQEGEADAVLASSMSEGLRGPVLYANTTGLPNQTAGEIARLKPSKIVVVGGQARVSDNTLQIARGYAAGLLGSNSTGSVERPRGITTAVADRCEELGYEVEVDGNEYHCDSRRPLN